MLHLCDTMTQQVRVRVQVQAPRASLLAVRLREGEQQTIERVATVASYNRVSRFLEALHIHGDDPR